MANYRNRGILFYPMEVGHTRNKRIRLLFNEFGPDAYWIWQCILDEAYGKYGYYFPATGEDVDLISADPCRKTPELVWQIIGSCVKRGLFDPYVHEKQNVLTNDKMQLNYIKATYDRRRKGSNIYLYKKHFIISSHDIQQFGEKFFNNVLFVETGRSILEHFPSDSLFSGEKQQTSSENNDNSPEKSPNSVKRREEKRREEKIYNTFSSADKSANDEISQLNGSIGIKPPDDISALAKNRKPARPKKFSSEETKLGDRIKTLWITWFKKRNNGKSPKYAAGEATAVKRIYKYFLSEASLIQFEEQEMKYDHAFEEFSHILERWDELSPNNFLFNCVDIKKINSNLTDIINFFNNGRAKGQNYSHKPTITGTASGAGEL